MNRKNRQSDKNSIINKALDIYRNSFAREENARRQALKGQYVKMGDKMFIVK